jgi:WD40 repeat protein
MRFAFASSLFFALTLLSPMQGNAIPPQPSTQTPVQFDARGDPLPEGAIARLGTTRLRHSGWRTSMLFSPDGKSLVTNMHSYNETRFLVWDAATGKSLPPLVGPYISVSSAVFSEDGTLMALGRHGTLVWDFASKRADATFLKHDDMYGFAFD